MPTAVMIETNEPIRPGMAQAACPGLGLLRREDAASYDNMLEAMHAGDSVLFIGAGPSSPLYGSWESLAEYMRNEARLVPHEETVFETFDRCRNALGARRYAELLIRRFGDERRSGHEQIHAAMVRAAFDTYVTTNLDCCLERANETVGGWLGRVWSYPDIISPADIGRRSLFHIHGRIHGGREDPDALEVVLGESDYERAYDDNQKWRIGNFIGELLVMSSRTVVFCGCGFRDHNLFFDCVRRAHARLRSLAEELRNVKRDVQARRHYAFLSVPTFEPHSAAGGDVIAYHNVNVADRVGVFNQVLSEYRPEIEIIPILYADPYPDDDDKSHLYLTKIFVDMAKKQPCLHGAPLVERERDVAS